jgi:hypothetical protein
VTIFPTGSTNPVDLPNELATDCAMPTIVSGGTSGHDLRRDRTWIRFVRGKRYSVEPVRLGNHEKRVLRLSDERCAGPGTISCPDRPRGCEHVNALCQVLPAVVAGGAA